MQRLRHILVGVDLDPTTGSLTEGSRAAASRALWLAGRTGAGIEYLYSTHRNSEDELAGKACSPEAGRAELEELSQAMGAGAVKLEVTDAPPALALARRVVADTSDLVVVGKRNQAQSPDRLLGSISMQLVRGCPSPVWVVKAEQQQRHQAIVAATDLSAVGDRATEYGAFLAGAEECELWVVHAWQMTLELQMSASRLGQEEFESRQKEIITAARDHILALPAVTDLGQRARPVVVRDAPSRAILAVVAESKPDLVVMGTISRSGVSGFLVGNTAERLLNMLDCSLLTVKPADFICSLE